MNLSVIIPVHNGERVLRQCLQALAKSSRLADEIIVIDDASTDSSGEVARAFGARTVILTGSPHGPAFARNQGADVAHGDVLVFFDADVAAHRDTLDLIDNYLTTQPEIAALFGSYDDSPPARGLVTLYKNLLHHYVHQHSQREASTFWAGSGAIRRDVFRALGGFNSNYAHPSVEDIELGSRLRRAGYRIWLCPDVQVAHLKRWSLLSLLRSDIFDRAVPWTRLILSSAKMPSDLNLNLKSKLSATAAWACVLFLALGLLLQWFWIAFALCVIAIAWLNIDLYRFFARRGGVRFAFGAFGLHVLYFLYSSFVFEVLWGVHMLRKSGLVRGSTLKRDVLAKGADYVR